MIKIQHLRVFFAYGLVFGTPLMWVVGLWYILLFRGEKLPSFLWAVNLGITVATLASWKNLQTLARYLATPKVLPTQEPKKEPAHELLEREQAKLREKIQRQQDFEKEHPVVTGTIKTFEYLRNKL